MRSCHPTRHPSTAAPLGAAAARARGWWAGRGRAGSGARRRRAALLARFRRSPLRRALAGALALVVLSFALEPLIADVHDGDAPVAELGRAPEPAAHGGDVAAHPTGGTTHIVSSDGSSHAPRDPRSGGAPAHSVHVCHGAHEHVAAAPDMPEPPDLAALHDVVQPTDSWRPSSHGAEPPVRPPIA